MDIGDFEEGDIIQRVGGDEADISINGAVIKHDVDFGGAVDDVFVG